MLPPLFGLALLPAHLDIGYIKGILLCILEKFTEGIFSIIIFYVQFQIFGFLMHPVVKLLQAAVHRLAAVVSPLIWFLPVSTMVIMFNSLKYSINFISLSYLSHPKYIQPVFSWFSTWQISL